MGAWCLFWHGVGGVRSGQVGYEGVRKPVAVSVSDLIPARAQVFFFKMRKMKLE